MRPVFGRFCLLVVVVSMAGCLSSSSAPEVAIADPPEGMEAAEGRVVVATFDTGTNPFHPCWQRQDVDFNSTFPELVGVAHPLRLSFHEDYESSLAQSRQALAAMKPMTLYHVLDTKLLFYSSENPANSLVDEPSDPIFDPSYHGAHASSLIACTDYGFSPDSWVVVVNWYQPQGNTASLAPEPEAALELLGWLAEQDWIDVAHFNFQRITPFPVATEARSAIRAVVASGKYVVFSAGNGWGNIAGHMPTETVDYFAVDGVHLAGAVDGSDYWYSSNLDPHTVMDGCGVVAADGDGFGEGQHSGTSFSSPLTAGYVAELLRLVRDATGASPGLSAGALVEIEDGWPLQGPLADGAMSASELHEVIRKTADPTLPPSRFDGAPGYICGQVPRAADGGGHDYHRIGYGKTTEDTLPLALAAILGEETIPDRPTADMYYEASNAVRDAYWGTVDP